MHSDAGRARGRPLPRGPVARSLERPGKALLRMGQARWKRKCATTEEPVLSRERAGMTEPAVLPASPTPFPRRASVGRGRARLLARGATDQSGPTSHSGGAASDSHRLPWALSLIPDRSVLVRVGCSQAARVGDSRGGGNPPESAGCSSGDDSRQPRRHQERQPHEHPDQHRTGWG